MGVDALTPNDSRVEHKFTKIGEHTYHYLLAKPEGKPVATIVLIHGWPDLSMAWRNQVMFLVSKGLQVVAPDMLGFGQTSAPAAVEEYTLKKLAGHIAHIAKEVTDQPIILGGHDWGAAMVWRTALYYPDLIRGVFSLCVPFNPPMTMVTTLEQMVEYLPNFRYQLNIASGDAERAIEQSPEHLRGFVRAVYGGRTEDGQHAVDNQNGINGDLLPRIQPSKILTPEWEDYWVEAFGRSGLHGCCNLYRTRVPVCEEEVPFAKTLPEDFKLPMPAMLVMAGKDPYLPPAMAEGQSQYFVSLKQEIVPESSHWMMVQCAEQLNKHIGDFVDQVLAGKSQASL